MRELLTGGSMAPFDIFTVISMDDFKLSFFNVLDSYCYIFDTSAQTFSKYDPLIKYFDTYIQSFC